MGNESTQQSHKHDIPSKTHFVKHFTMEYTIWVDIDSTQQPNKHDISLQNTIFLAFTKEYTICVGIDTNSTATQTRYSITKHHFSSDFRWNIRFVWVLSGLNSNTNTIFQGKTPFCLAFCYVICFYVGMESSQLHINTILRCKIPKFLSFCDGI